MPGLVTPSLRSNVAPASRPTWAIAWTAALSVSVAAAGGTGLAVEIRDDGGGTGTIAPGTGMGLRGMRERVEATAGRFDAAPAPSGGFVVRAVWDAA